MKNYTSYFHMENTEFWMADIVEEFRDFFADGGRTVRFAGQMEQQNRFLQLCDKHNLTDKLHKASYRLVSRSEIGKYSHFQLQVKEDNFYPRPKFIDFKEACPGVGTRKCGVGAVQNSKIAIDSAKSKSLDIMTVSVQPAERPYPYPSPIVVSRKLYELARAEGFRGCEFVPCLQPSTTYSENERSFGSVIPSLQEDATHFQLIVTGRTSPPPYVDEIGGYRICDACGTLYNWFRRPQSKHGVTFDRDALGNLAFQNAPQIASGNLGILPLRRYPTIVAGRVIQFLLDHKAKGLDSHTDDARLPFMVAEVAF